MLEQLNHQGVIVPDLPEPLGLFIIARGRRIDLTPEQEEMAMAWAAKKDTPYAEDPVFVRNFMQDFSRALQIEPVLGLDEVDFTLYYARVDENRSLKEALSAEERKALAAERKQVARGTQGALRLCHRQRAESRAGHLHGRAERHLYGAWPAPVARALEAGRPPRGHHAQLRARTGGPGRWLGGDRLAARVALGGALEGQAHRTSSSTSG